MKEKIFVVVLALVTFFAFNTALPTDIMESRNIVTAREIATEGNWLVPTMNGSLRLEKPPLPTWVAAAIETVCPHSLSAQRTAAGVMGMIWTIFLFLFAKLLAQSGAKTGGYSASRATTEGYLESGTTTKAVSEKFALLTVMVFLTSYHIVVMGRTATWDIYCHTFMMGGIYFLTKGLLSSKAWKWFPLAGVMMGLSFMSKGPVSFYALLLPALIAIIAFLHPSLKGKWGPFIAMLVICVVIGSWWYIYLLVCQPEAVDIVIHKESGAWTNHNVRPWYYYWRFFTETGIWAVLMLAALAIPYWKRHLTPNAQHLSPNTQHLSSNTQQLSRNTYFFSITWTLAALVLLSLMPEKKIRYLLPMMAPCALSVACLLQHFETAKDKPNLILMRVNGYIVTLIAIAIPMAAIIRKWLPLPLTIIVSMLFLLTAVYIAMSTYKLQSRHIVYGVCVMFMLTELFVLKPIGALFGNPDRHSISVTQNMPQLKNVPFYHATKDNVRIELVYEAGKKVLPLNTTDSATVASHLPFVLISHGYASKAFSAKTLQMVDTVSLGTFDDNKHPKKSRYYTKDFITHLTLVKGKKVKK